MKLHLSNDFVVSIINSIKIEFSSPDLHGAFQRRNDCIIEGGIVQGVGRGCAAPAGCDFPDKNLRLLGAMKALGKPVITVVIAGRPYETCFLDQVSDALVYSFYPGLAGGEAIAKLLFGEIEPAGRLNASLPNEAHQLPCYYNHKDSYKPQRYYDGTAKPKYGFGSGLSYTSFDFALVSAPTAENREVALTVTNTGARPGYAVPQLYLHRTQGAVTSRIRQLCGFKKLYLQPGESKTVTIAIPEDSLRQYDYAMKSVLLPGKIEWFLCDSGETKLDGYFVL